MLGAEKARYTKIVSTIIALFITLSLMSALKVSASVSKNAPLIVFDESHRPIISAFYKDSPAPGQFSMLVNLLKSHGFSVSAIVPGQVITEELLKGVDALVIVPGERNYSVSEINAIVKWVEEGGKLLILGEYDHYNTNIDALTRKLGFVFESQEFNSSFMNIAQPDSYKITPIYPVFNGSLINRTNEIMKDINRVITYSITSIKIINNSIKYITLIRTSEKAYWFDTYRYKKGPSAANEPVAILLHYGKGIVIAIGDTSLWVNYDIDKDGTPSIYEGDNYKLAINIFKFLANYSVKNKNTNKESKIERPLNANKETKTTIPKRATSRQSMLKITIIIAIIAITIILLLLLYMKYSRIIHK